MKVDDKAKREQLLNEIRGLIAADGCINLVHWQLTPSLAAIPTLVVFLISGIFEIAVLRLAF